MVALVLLLGGCAMRPSVPRGADRHPHTTFSRSVSLQIERLLERVGPRVHPALSQTRNRSRHRALVRFYATSRYEPSWVGPRGALRQADDLVAALERAQAQGLPGAVYRLSDLRQAVADSRRGSSAETLARLDVWLSETFIVHADHLRRGLIDPRQLDIPWHVPDPPGDLAGLLSTGLALHDIGAALQRLAPRRRVYAQMLGLGEDLTGVDRRRLEANLERWRWLPRDLGSDYLLVRLAAFELDWVHARVHGSSHRIIIGEPYRRTPSFASQVTDLVVHPSWHVPERIAREELVPRAQRDPGSLAAAGFRMWQGQREVAAEEIDWQDPEQTSSLRFIQAPGVTNPLGRLKYQLANPFAIFLHDTPAPGLFAESARDLSHGCVRVEGAVDLARQILPAPAARRLERLLRRGETAVVPLPTPLPVYFIYWTVDVVDGRLRELEDIYAEDAALLVALAQASAIPHTNAWLAEPPRVLR